MCVYILCVYIYICFLYIYVQQNQATGWSCWVWGLEVRVSGVGLHPANYSGGITTRDLLAVEWPEPEIPVFTRNLGDCVSP